MRKFLIAAIFLFLLPISVSAHGGKTDSNGGHTDHSTGEYHYHHGYPAHDHRDMDGDGIKDCPYEFDDKTDHSHNNSNNTGNNTGNKPTDSSPSISQPDSNSKKQAQYAWWEIALGFLSYLMKAFIGFFILLPIWAIISLCISKLFKIRDSIKDKIDLSATVVIIAFLAVWCFVNVFSMF